MIKFWRVLTAAAMALCVLAISPQGALAQVKVITSGGFAAPLREMLPEFEKSAGISVEVILGKSQGSGPDTIGAQLGRGVVADVVIMSREGLNDLISANRIVAHSDIDVAKTPIGLAVRAGAPKPDISTVEAFKNTLLHAKSITYPSSTTGIYMATGSFHNWVSRARYLRKLKCGCRRCGKGRCRNRPSTGERNTPCARHRLRRNAPHDVQYNLGSSQRRLLQAPVEAAKPRS